MTPTFAALSVTVAGFQIPGVAIVLGAITGLLYGLLAVGLILIYRSNRLINFAHGQIGAFAAAVFGVAVTRWHVPYWIAFAPALALGGATGATAEMAVVRRLRNSPKVMSIVATLGFGQFLLLLALAVNNSISGFKFPSPPGMPEFTMGALRITRAYSGMVVLGLLAVVGLVLFLRTSRVGVGMRSAAANPDAARMAGIAASRMSSLAWALAGGLSAMTAILVAPTQGIISGDSFGPTLLLRALTVAVIARMVSLPMAVAGGVGLGIVEGLLLWNYPRGGLVEMALFVIILGALLVQRSVGGREDEKGTWASVQPWRPIPDAWRRVWLIRNLGLVVGLAALGLMALLPLAITNTAAIVMVGIFAFGIVGLSVGIVTGLGGQLSLGQFAIAAIGAVVSWQVAFRTGNYGLAFLYAGLAAAGASLIVGLPALRLRGLMLTVTTLGFALVVPSWLLQQPWMLGEGANPGRPIVFGVALVTGKQYYFFALAVLALATTVAANVRRTGLSRVLVAVRDNEDNARAFTIRARAVKMQGFLLAGFVAGVGGAVYAHTLARIAPTTFGATGSIDVAVMTALGGLGTVIGPLIGVFYYIGFPSFVPLDAAGLAGTQLMGLLLILYLPGGLAQLLRPVRDGVLGRLARRAGVVDAVDQSEAEAAPGRTVVPHVVAQGVDRRPACRGPLLEAVSLSKRYGGLTAVDDVSLQVFPGETLGLIGPNGAGKTTFFELLSGFNRPDGGRVYFQGEDVTHLSPEARARLGLIRSFQDAALFPTMTALDVVKLALEHRYPTRFLPAVLGLQGSEKARAAEADELIGFMGLGGYRNAQVQELSTGTRRIVEIACLVALQPTLLLLDEPSSGIAQRETEALGALLQELKGELDMTLVVIEHDMPLIMGLADRMLAMDAGRPIAEGTPDEIRSNPLVVDAYLGGSIDAIERSGTTRRVPPGGANGRAAHTNGSASSSYRPRRSRTRAT